MIEGKLPHLNYLTLAIQIISTNAMYFGCIILPVGPLVDSHSHGWNV